MNKRGQVTIFLIVGIILLFVSAGAYMIINKVTTGSFLEEEQESHFKEGVGAPLVSFIEQCIEERAVQGIEIAGLQGGFIFPTEDDVLLTEETLIGYVYKDKTQRVDTAFVEDELGIYVDIMLPECIQNFSNLTHLYDVTEQGRFIFDREIVSEDAVELPFAFHSFTDVKIQENIVLFTTQYPLEITGGGETFTLDTFAIRIPSVLGNALSLMTMSVDSQADNNMIDFRLFSKQEPTVTIFPFDTENTIYNLYYGEENLPDVFLYAINNNINREPKIIAQDKYFLKVNEIFTTKIKVEEYDADAIEFISTDKNFPIQRDGTITIMPKDVGIFDVQFIARDAFGGETRKDILFVVERGEGEVLSYAD